MKCEGCGEKAVIDTPKGSFCFKCYKYNYAKQEIPKHLGMTAFDFVAIGKLDGVDESEEYWERQFKILVKEGLASQMGFRNGRIVYDIPDMEKAEQVLSEYYYQDEDGLFRRAK